MLGNSAEKTLACANEQYQQDVGALTIMQNLDRKRRKMEIQMDELDELIKKYNEGGFEVLTIAEIAYCMERHY